MLLEDFNLFYRYQPFQNGLDFSGSLFEQFSFELNSPLVAPVKPLDHRDGLELVPGFLQQSLILFLYFSPHDFHRQLRLLVDHRQLSVC